MYILVSVSISSLSGFLSIYLSLYVYEYVDYAHLSINLCFIIRGDFIYSLRLVNNMLD
jgi:hypothetical protein